MQVLKFGGTSMGDENTWRRVLDIIQRHDHPFVVVSATAQTTRTLIAAAEKAVDHPEEAKKLSEKIRQRHLMLVSNFMNHFPGKDSGKALKQCNLWINTCITILYNHLKSITKQGKLTADAKDAVASLGEQLSSYLLVRCGCIYGLNMEWIDARQVIKTDSQYGNASPLIKEISTTVALLTERLNPNQIPVTGGYYGENKQGMITTLGFEGSDFTPSLLAAALDAESIKIWTDVSGIYTCDPRIVSEAVPIRKLSFHEATELAYFGAKVLHPSTMKPASQKNIPIFVKNIFVPDHPGTKIHAGAISDNQARAMTFLEDMLIVTVSASETLMGYEFLSGVFKTLGDLRTLVDVVTTTEASVSVALEASRNTEAIQARLGLFGKVDTATKQGLISLVGCAFNDIKTITEVVFNAIPTTEPEMIAFSKTKKNLNIVLPGQQLRPTVHAIHHQLFSPDLKKQNR